MGDMKSIGVAFSDQDLNGSIINVTRQLGYTSKNRGSVTQQTSKSTAVTLNAPVGTVTTNNALLAASGNVSFTVNNSFVNANTTVLFNIASSAPAYIILVKNVRSGAFDISITNNAGVSNSDTLVFNFALVNGNP